MPDAHPARRPASLCRGCGTRLTTCYPDQQYHPMCDPDPPGWSDEDFAYWSDQVARRVRDSRDAEAASGGYVRDGLATLARGLLPTRDTLRAS